MNDDRFEGVWVKDSETSDEILIDINTGKAVATRHKTSGGDCIIAEAEFVR